MMNAQELKAQRQRLGLEAEAATRDVQQNGGKNQPRVVDENRGVDGLIPPQRQPIAPRGRAQHPAHMMYDEAGATRAIVLPTLPPGVKFTITRTMIQLLNLKGMFRAATGDDTNQHLMNFVAIYFGGSFMRKPLVLSMQLLDEVSKNNRAWYTRDAEVGELRYTFKVLAEQRKREEERDQDMAHMMTQIDLLTKHIVTKSEKDLDLDEEANYLGNQGGFQNYNFGNQGYNSGNTGRNYARDGQYERPPNRYQGNWQNRDGYRNDRSGVYVPPGNRERASRSSCGSRMGDMMAKVLQKVESTDAGIKEMRGDFSCMSQFVDSHTTSIKQIEQPQ
ncbi:hypothetical protein KY285_026547 [Solanum tuberosum]|nr:hypothetical protein KY285_026547 [Solanum tuberosum]